MGRMSGCTDCVGEEIIAGCMALFTLSCRNGLSLCGQSAEMIEMSSRPGQYHDQSLRQV